MIKGKISKGNNLIEFLLEINGFTLWSGKEQIEDLATFDLFKWYYIDIQIENKEVHIVEVEFAESSEELNSLLQ